MCTNNDLMQTGGFDFFFYLIFLQDFCGSARVLECELVFFPLRKPRKTKLEERRGEKEEKQFPKKVIKGG